MCLGRVRMHGMLIGARMAPAPKNKNNRLSYYCFRSRKVREPSSSKVGDRLPDYFLDISVYTPDRLSKKVLNNTHQ